MHALKICGAIKTRSGDLDLRGFNLTRGFLRWDYFRRIIWK